MQDHPRPDGPLERHTPEAATALVHLYRGELGRMTSYRRRLDTTTNWAISFVGAVASVGLGTDSVPHAVFLAAMIWVLFFLVIEAGRFRHYEVSRARVLTLESGYFPDVIRGNTSWPWTGALLDQIRNPRPPLDRWAALGWRLRRNYLWIYFAVLVIWILKLDFDGGRAGSLGTLIERAQIGALPGSIVVLAVLAFYGALIALTALAKRRYPHGEDW